MKPKVDSSISWLRVRKQRSGALLYFLELPGVARRIEIALGPDFEVALKRRSQILFSHFTPSSNALSSNELILDRYRKIVVPTLPVSQKSENLKSIKRLTAFLRHSEFAAKDISKFESEYLKWRDSRLTLRARSEVALFIRIIRWDQGMRNATNPCSPSIEHASQ